jgi:UDP-glucose 4-epimerase
MNVLVTGGGGYIGSHTVKALIDKGHDVLILDSFIYGHKRLIHPAARVIECDLRDRAKVFDVFRSNKVDAVFHFAGLICVGESFKDPSRYYDFNLSAGLNLLCAMSDFGVKKIVFSSSAAVYGDPVRFPVEESDPLFPVNPYGNTKLVFERMLSDFSAAHGISFVALRYFNACGADPDCMFGELHEPETHLIPLIFDAASGKRHLIDVFGSDYPTKDGTCVRDYVHVCDLADAHVIALGYLESGNVNACFNLGSQNGFSNLEIIKAVERITGNSVPYRFVGRRKGDPAVLVASSAQARDVLGWSPKMSDIDTIIRTAWDWYNKKEKFL